MPCFGSQLENGNLFTDILSAVGLLSTGNRKHIKKLLLYAIYHSTHLHITFIHIVDGAKLNLKLHDEIVF
jgi:hypothetical protein